MFEHQIARFGVAVKAGSPTSVHPPVAMSLYLAFTVARISPRLLATASVSNALADRRQARRNSLAHLPNSAVTDQYSGHSLSVIGTSDKIAASQLYRVHRRKGSPTSRLEPAPTGPYPLPLPPRPPFLIADP